MRRIPVPDDPATVAPPAVPVAPIRILTIDLEDWFHLLEWPGTDDPARWPDFESRIEHGTDRILDVLSRHQARATFFCLGWVAEHHPHVVRRIVDLGHEVGTHGYGHRVLNALDHRSFGHDLRRSIHAIADATGVRPTSYRAPGFSITPRTTWALDVLCEHEITVDSSIFPTRRAHGGYRGGCTRPSWIECRSGRLMEFPVTIGGSLKSRLPCSGGGYFRLAPYAVSRRLIHGAEYAMTYFHPRDFDASQPRLPGMGPIRRFRSYFGIRGAFSKFARLVQDVNFVDLQTAVRLVRWQDAPLVTVDHTATPLERNGAYGSSTPARPATQTAEALP